MTTSVIITNDAPSHLNKKVLIYLVNAVSDIGTASETMLHEMSPGSGARVILEPNQSYRIAEAE